MHNAHSAPTLRAWQLWRGSLQGSRIAARESQKQVRYRLRVAGPSLIHRSAWNRNSQRFVYNASYI
jgi:hypothetical protein